MEARQLGGLGACPPEYFLIFGALILILVQSEGALVLDFRTLASEIQYLQLVGKVFLQ